MPNIKASIEITVYDDGTLSVSKESGPEETGENGAEQPEGQQADSVDDALEIARGMVQSAVGDEEPEESAVIKPVSKPTNITRGPEITKPMTMGNWK
jgi:hypothetical protein